MSNFFGFGRKAEAEYWEILQELRPQKMVKYSTPYFLRGDYDEYSVQIKIPKEYLKKYNESKLRLFFEPALILKLKKVVKDNVIDIDKIDFYFCKSNAKIPYEKLREEVL